MSFAKHLVRYAVIAGLVGGAAALVAGPHRMGALLTQTRQSINGCIDRNIDDPIALRSQMKQLEGQYPERIAEVRGDLAELREQTSQLKRELQVSDRVVALADNDLTQMQAMIDKAQTTQASLAGGNQIVRVVFGNEPMDLKDAYGKANKIQQVRNAYATRATEIQRESRLSTLLGQLETEHQEFQAQLWQMDRQVDTISRNERLIGMMEKRQRTLDEQGRYTTNSLDQLSARFADIRATQEARLESLGQSSNALNYEDRAKFDLDSRARYETQGFESLPTLPVSPTVIEITPEHVQPAPAAAKPLALRAN
jgi:predicted RNase H-like nuclease (RuvC/YqgF family)